MKILSKRTLLDGPISRIIEMKILSPDIAAKARPGEFVVLMVSEQGERIPLTVVDTDQKQGSVTIIFQQAGFSTTLLAAMNAGDSLYAFVGPLGHPTEIKKYGQVILVGGGVGIAEIYPVARAMKESGNHVTTILGARTKEMLILEEELRSASHDFHVATDDGSYGRKGFTVDILKDLLTKNSYDLVYSVGPIPMMKFTALATREFHVKTLVSLNAIMIDGTGMCGGCRVTVGREAKFTCVDGPEFDAHQVDWAGLEKRNKIYAHQEQHACRLAAEMAKQ